MKPHYTEYVCMCKYKQCVVLKATQVGTCACMQLQYSLLVISVFRLIIMSCLQKNVHRLNYFKMILFFRHKIKMSVCIKVCQASISSKLAVMVLNAMNNWNAYTLR